MILAVEHNLTRTGGIPASRDSSRTAWTRPRTSLFAGRTDPVRVYRPIPWCSRCGTEPVDNPVLVGQACFAGLDLSTTTDVSALSLVFPDSDGTVAVVSRFWIPGDNAEKRERRDRVPYQTWCRQRLIDATPGNVIDYGRIRSAINELSRRFEIREIAIDPWNSTQLALQLQGDGFEVVTFGQGIREMTAPTKELEKRVMSGKLHHGGHPVLRWMASNVAVETDAAGNLKPSKKKSTERIDGIVATIMALGRTMKQEKEYVSVYDNRG